MDIGERLSVAWRALVGVFSEDSARQAHGLLQGIFPAGAGDPPQRGARERVAAYADMPWLHAVADKVASAFAAVEWRLAVVRRRGDDRAVRMKSIQRAGADERRNLLLQRQQAGELIAVEQHPLLDLLEGGNSFMTGLGLRKVTSLHLDLEGEAFWLKERSRVGVPVGAWPLPPDWVRALPTPSSRYFRVGFRGWQGMIPDTEIVWMQNHNPSNPYGRGTGLARALADELETDEYAAHYIRQVFFNQARPDFVVYPKAPATWGDSERARLQQDWRSQHEGFWRAAKARFASREIGVYEFGQTDFRHLQMAQLRQHERDCIVQVWGLPPELLGLLENSNRATISAADYLFARWVLVPRLEAFRAMLQERLIPEYDDRLIVDYVSPVKEDDARRLDAARAAPWAITLDEWRAMQGLAPLPDGAGNVFFVPFNLQPTREFGGEGGFGASSGMDLAALREDERLALRRLAPREWS